MYSVWKFQLEMSLCPMLKKREMMQMYKGLKNLSGRNVSRPYYVAGHLLNQGTD